MGIARAPSFSGLDTAGIAYLVLIIIKIKIHCSCETEDFVETHLCKLCVILRSRVFLGVYPH